MCVPIAERSSYNISESGAGKRSQESEVGERTERSVNVSAA